MFVENLMYNEKRGGWDYMLRNENNKIHGWVKETDIRR